MENVESAPEGTAPLVIAPDGRGKSARTETEKGGQHDTVSAACVNSRDNGPSPRIATVPCVTLKAPDSQQRLRAYGGNSIDADKAERMIAQMIRDEGGLRPAKANALAADICRRLSVATLATPLAQNYRIISKSPPYASDFAVAIANILADAKDMPLAPEDLWRLVYDRGRDLPATVADPRL